MPKEQTPGKLSDYREIAVISVAKKLYLRAITSSVEGFVPKNSGVLGGAPGCATSIALAKLSIAAEKAEAW